MVTCMPSVVVLCYVSVQSIAFHFSRKEAIRTSWTSVLHWTWTQFGLKIMLVSECHESHLLLLLLLCWSSVRLVCCRCFANYCNRHQSITLSKRWDNFSACIHQSRHYKNISSPRYAIALPDNCLLLTIYLWCRVFLHTAYSMAKYGMSLCVLGMSEELRADGIAVNALWPKTG